MRIIKNDIRKKDMQIMQVRDYKQKDVQRPFKEQTSIEREKRKRVKGFRGFFNV